MAVAKRYWHKRIHNYAQLASGESAAVAAFLRKAAACVLGRKDEMANAPGQNPIVGRLDGTPHTYRVNTGTVTFVPFTANSAAEACDYVRRHQNPDHAAARWLQILQDGVFVWLTP
jgi:hypothetical protein